ncbi:MAG: flagellar basal body-associated FliL family protein [Spirochaetota bacterium]
MADDMFETDDDVVAAEESQAGQKRVGFLPGVLIQVLKWVGIILAAVIFIVTVVVVALNVVNRGTRAITDVPTSEDYRAEEPILEWFQQIGELRGSTADEVRTTFIVEPFLGYDGDNDSLTTELIDRRIQLMGLFNDYFGSKTTEELEGPANKARVRQELQDQINRILRSGQIRDIVFGSYQFLPF